MFDQLLPPLYLQLRIKIGLSKSALADRLGVSRHTVANYEAGTTRPDADYERRLIELAGCSPRELAQMLCELLAELIERPVVILEPQAKAPLEPPSVLDDAERAARQLKHFIRPSMQRTLANQIHVTRMMQLVLERQIADLAELAADCRAAAFAPAAAPATTPQGATGPVANGPASDNRTDGTPPARPQSQPQSQPMKGTAP